MKTTIPASQRLARGERIDPDDFAGLRDAGTAVLAGFDLGKPLVCAINGHCRAVGLDLMLASELRFAVPHATFALEEVARGLYPTGNATVLLPRQIALGARDGSAAHRATDLGVARRGDRPDQRGRRARGAAAARARGRRRDRRERAARGARDTRRRARAARACRSTPPTGGRRSSGARCARRRMRPKARARSSRSASRSGRRADEHARRATPRLARSGSPRSTREFRVPGASLAVIAERRGLRDGAAACSTSRTGVEATPDSVFQMGSITKVWTTTLVMQLVDEGKLDLDARVAEVLPAFGLADAAAARAITLRQLLPTPAASTAISSWTPGAVTTRSRASSRTCTASADPCAGRALLVLQRRLRRRGPAGRSAAGRELRRGAARADPAPLGLRATGTLPEQAILHRAAAGHFAGADGTPHVVPVWSLQHSNAPAGATPFTTASELLALRAHAPRRRRCPSGARLLSARSGARDAGRGRSSCTARPARWRMRGDSAGC